MCRMCCCFMVAASSLFTRRLTIRTTSRIRNGVFGSSLTRLATSSIDTAVNSQSDGGLTRVD